MSASTRCKTIGVSTDNAHRSLVAAVGSAGMALGCGVAVAFDPAGASVDSREARVGITKPAALKVVAVGRTTGAGCDKLQPHSSKASKVSRGMVGGVSRVFMPYSLPYPPHVVTGGTAFLSLRR